MIYLGQNAVQDAQSVTIQKSDLGISENATAQQIFTALIEQARRYSQGIIEINGKPLLATGNDPLEYDNSRGKSISIYYTRNDVINGYKVALFKLFFRIPGNEIEPININLL